MRKQRLAGTAPAVAAAALIAGGAAAQDRKRMTKPSIPASGCHPVHPGGIVDDEMGTFRLNSPAIGLSINSLEGL